jgi:hypothetical protein
MDDSAPLLTAAAIAIGLFYGVGGVLLLRRLPSEAVMDQMLAALGDPDAAGERQRTRWWMVGGTATFASGLALLLLSRWTPLFFALAALFQAVYLLWSGRALPPRDEITRAGRRSTIRAFLLYLAACVLVWRLDRDGLWRAGLEPAVLELLLLAGVSGAVAVLLLRQAFWTAPTMPEPLPQAPARLRLSPEYRMSPLRDEAENTPIDPAALGLDDALVARIAAWDGRFQALFDDEDPFAFDFPDLATEQAWFEEGLAIAGEIQRAWMGTLRNDLSGLDAMIGYARRALEPVQETPIAQAAAMAPRCGVAEIREAIGRLDRLAWQKDGVEAWDGDTRNAIARDQLFLAHVLGHVRERYLPEVRRGLDSQDEETRRWVRAALAMRGAA